MPKRNTILAAVFGSAVTLALTLSLGAGEGNREVVGRYQVVATEKYALVLDTTNGVVWHRYLGDVQYVDPGEGFVKAKR